MSAAGGEDLRRCGQRAAVVGGVCLVLAGVTGGGGGAPIATSDAGSDSTAARCEPPCAQGQPCGIDGVCLGQVAWSFPLSHVLYSALDLALAADGTVIVPSADLDELTAHLQGLSPN